MSYQSIFISVTKASRALCIVMQDDLFFYPCALSYLAYHKGIHPNVYYHI